MSAMPPVRLFTPTEYLEIIAAGTLKDAHKLELIQGRIVAKMSRNAPHELVLSRLARLLVGLLPEEILWRVQASLELVDSVPEPDLMLIQSPDTLYLERHPQSHQTYLVVEVSDTSLAQDLGDKLTAYALAKIPEYWVVDIPHRQIHVFTKPKGGKKPGYKSQVTYSDVDSVPVFDVGDLKVSEVLP
ncbi:MAG: Uma2 family endonuclease [Fimbriiglobus sp.]